MFCLISFSSRIVFDFCDDYLLGRLKSTRFVAAIDDAFNDADSSVLFLNCSLGEKEKNSPRLLQMSL